MTTLRTMTPHIRWTFACQGSHMRLKRRRGKETLIVIVPTNRVLAKGTLRSILRQANLTVEDDSVFRLATRTRFRVCHGNTDLPISCSFLQVLVC